MGNEQESKRIVDFLNSHPGYEPAWDTFIQAHPDFKNADPNLPGARSTYDGIWGYFGGQWDTSAGRKPGDDYNGSVQKLGDTILSGNPGTKYNSGNPTFVADPTGPSTAAPPAGAPPAAAPPAAPGVGNTKTSTPQEIAQEMFQWSAGFKGNAGHAPTRAEWVEAWGDAGGQTYDWGVGLRNQGVDVTQNIPFFNERVGNIIKTADAQGGLGGSLGSTYAQPATLDQQKLDVEKDQFGQQMGFQKTQFDWTKDYQTARAAAQDAQFAAQNALAQGNQQLAKDQFAYAKQQGDLSNAIQLAGLTGTYNGQPTLAMQAFAQNQANFEKQFGLTLEQFNFQKDSFAKQYGLDEASVTGMFKDKPTLAMQQFLQNKDQFAQTLKLQTASLTGRLDGNLTLEGQTVAYNAARAGNPLQYLQTIQGGPPVNYAGMPQPNQNPTGQAPAPGVAPSLSTQPVGQPVIAGQEAQTFGGVQQQMGQLPQAPQNIQNIMAGAPLPTANVTAPGVRLAGAQAQANETPLQKAARMESYELAGARQEDVMDAESKIKRNLGTGLRSASYRGAPGGRQRYQ